MNALSFIAGVLIIICEIIVVCLSVLVAFLWSACRAAGVYVVNLFK